MQVDHGDRKVVSSGVTAKGTFALSSSQAGHAHLMALLRDNIYTDKVLAVLREYAANAWDAHRMVGKFDLPIKVTLPTEEDPTLFIRDYGPGMSMDDVFQVYTQYGESTKRGTNDAVGQMGIGSKSAFAYTDAFTVTSWNGGMKRIYVAVLDSTNVGEMQCLDESPCDAEETGIEIQVPVIPKDINEFRDKAFRLFRYFDPQPEINRDLPAIKRDTLTTGFLSSDLSEWVGVMGCIPYRINLQQIQTELEEAGLWTPLQRIKGGLNFPIGAVDIAASREELKYTERTRKAIIDQFVALMDEHVERALRDLKDDTISDWEKRQRAYFMAHVIGFKLPKGYADWGKESVELFGYKMAPEPVLDDKGQPVLDEDGNPCMEARRKPNPKKFVFLRQGTDEASHIIVTQGNGLRIVLRDDDRELGGFRFAHRDYVVRPKKDVPVAEAEAELDEYLKEARLTGVPVHKLTDLNLYWTKPYTPDPIDRVKNPKHWTQAFKLDANPRYTSQHSDNWEAHKWDAQPDDVYVVLEHFLPNGYSTGFYDTIMRDKEMAGFLGVPFPTVYGYKNTVTKPLDMSKVKGVPYKEWRQDFFKDALASNPKVKTLVEAMSWSKAVADRDSGISEHLTWSLEQTTERLNKDLPGHVLTAFFDKTLTATKFVWANRNTMTVVERLIDDIKPDTTAKETLNALKKAYPVLFHIVGVFDMHRELSAWINYIQVADKAAAFDAQAAAVADAILADLDKEADVLLAEMLEEVGPVDDLDLDAIMAEVVVKADIDLDALVQDIVANEDADVGLVYDTAA